MVIRHIQNYLITPPAPLVPSAAYKNFTKLFHCLFWFLSRVALGANRVEQFARHFKKDVDLNGAVECLDGTSDSFRSTFGSRTRYLIFKDENGMRRFLVLHEFRDGFVVKGVPTGLFIAEEDLAVLHVFE